MQSNFNRQYRLRVEPAGAAQGFEIGQTPTGGAPLHISFSCERADAAILNTASITIWNLSKEHREALGVMGTKVYLSAGYDDTLPLVFTGTIVQCDTERDGGDRKTTLQCVDGFEAFENKVVTVSFDRRITCLELMKYISRKIIGEPVFTSTATDLMNHTVAETYSWFGKAAGMLDEICGAAGVEWKIDNGVMQVSAPNEPIGQKAYVISADTGLIGYPKRIFESSVGLDENNESTASYSLIGWEVEYLMNGAIGVGNKVQLKSKEQGLDGTYYVYNLQITGDNYGGDWKCTAKLRAVSSKTEIDLVTTGG